MCKGQPLCVRQTYESRKGDLASSSLKGCWWLPVAHDLEGVVLSQGFVAAKHTIWTGLSFRTQRLRYDWSKDSSLTYSGLVGEN